MSFALRLTPAAASALLLAACGGGSSTSPPLPSSGYAIDGPISGMTVLCDGNGVTATTNGAGKFTFAAPGCASSLTGRGGADIETLLVFKGVLKAPAGATVLTPLTTLLAEGMTFAQVLGMLGLPASVDLLHTDPSVKSAGVLVNPDLMKRTLVVEQLLQTAAEVFALLGGVASAADVQAIYGEVAAAHAVLMMGGGTLVAGSAVDPTLVASLVKAAAQRVSQATGVAPAVKAALAAIHVDSLAQVSAGALSAQADALLKTATADVFKTAKLVQSDDSISVFVKANAAAMVSAPSAATATMATTLTAQVTANITGGNSGGGGGSGGGAVSVLPVTFEETTAPVLTGFGGAEDSSVVTDPVAGTGKVAKVIKAAGSEVWAGTTVSTGANQSIAAVPFATGATSMNLRVWSPDKGIPVRLKLEDASNKDKSVEAEATTTVAGGWQTLTFNFANPAAGTAALNLATTYNKASVFFNFGTAGTGKTYYFDDLAFGAGPSTGGGGGGGGGAVSVLPVTFEETTAPVLTGFGGAEDATVVTDPVAGSGKVAKVVKAAGSEVWAGTTVSTGANQSIATVPFATGATSMNLRVWSPDKGIPVRLKLEDASNKDKSVETEATTTVASGWQTLTFNFANQAAGTAALNLATVYNKASVFFNFGTAGSGKTYYFDDLAFGAGPVITPPAPTDYLALVADSISLVNGGSVTSYTMAQFQSDAGIRVSWPLPAPMTMKVTLAEVGSYVIPAGMKLSAAVSISETVAGGKGETQAYIENVSVVKTANGLEITVPSTATAMVYSVSGDGKKKAVIDFSRDVAGITNTLKTAAGSSNNILFGSIVNYGINKLSNDFTGIYGLRGKYRVSVVLNNLPLRQADGSLLPAVTVVVPTQINSTGAVVASKTMTGAGLVGFITLVD